MSIQSKHDYIFYLEADEISLFIPENTRERLREMIFNQIWKFQRILRKTEYYTNCRKGLIWRSLVFLMQYRLSRYGFKLGYEIPPNVFGPGLSDRPPGVDPRQSVRSHRGELPDKQRRHHRYRGGICDKCPTIGKNAFIGTGAQIFGTIKIGDNIAIGANAVVTKSFEENDISIAGVPAVEYPTRFPVTCTSRPSRD